MVDSNYREVLKFIVDEMYKYLASTGEAEDQRTQEISDLREDGSVYSMEKALVMMYNPENGIQNFNGTNLEKCKDSSKNMMIERIDCIHAIHNIRNILAHQCFIGLVGIQDAGTSTLLNTIFVYNFLGK